MLNRYVIPSFRRGPRSIVITSFVRILCAAACLHCWPFASRERRPRLQPPDEGRELETAKRYFCGTTITYDTRTQKRSCHAASPAWQCCLAQFIARCVVLCCAGAAVEDVRAVRSRGGVGGTESHREHCGADGAERSLPWESECRRGRRLHAIGGCIGAGTGRHSWDRTTSRARSTQLHIQPVIR